MFGRSFQVARIGGIVIEIHPSWFLILAFLVWSLSSSFLPELYEGWAEATYWIMGTIAAVSLFLAVLIHELAHAVVAKRRGLDVPRITLFIFGGVSHLARQPRSPGEEFAIAIAGPITSVLIAITAGLAYLAVFDRQEQLEALFGYLALVNTLLAVFNLLPGFPLDGGRVLRSIAWKRSNSFRKATRTAGGIGEFFGWTLVFIGVFTLFASVWNGIWFMFVGWFLASAARAEVQNIKVDSILNNLTARDVMHEEYAKVTPGTDLQSAVDTYFLGQGERSLVVSLGDSVGGIVTVTDVNRVPRAEWSQTPVQRVMTPPDRIVTVEAATPALEVLMLLGQKHLNQIPVLDRGRLIGLISRRELVDRIQLAEELAPDDDIDATG